MAGDGADQTMECRLDTARHADERASRRLAAEERREGDRDHQPHHEQRRCTRQQTARAQVRHAAHGAGHSGRDARARQACRHDRRGWRHPFLLQQYVSTIQTSAAQTVLRSASGSWPTRPAAAIVSTLRRSSGHGAEERVLTTGRTGWSHKGLTRAPAISPVQLTISDAAGTHVTLRPPDVGDFPSWREGRLDDEGLIRPFWATGAQSWDDQHSRATWVRHILDWRELARRGSGTTFVVDVDGEFTGELFLSGVDAAGHSGELGIWLHSRVAGRGVGCLVIELTAWYALDRLGLRRVEAPVATENHAALAVLERTGFRSSSAAVRHLDVGGSSRPHLTWTRSASTHHSLAADHDTAMRPLVRGVPARRIELRPAAPGRVVTHDLNSAVVASRRAAAGLRRRARGG
jgi:RimJ/RimL family protein N-acetyltransferase